MIAIDDRLDRSIDISPLFSQFKSLEIVRTAGGQGYGNALELGSQIIESQVCALMNSDDLVHPDRFKLQIRSLENVDLSFTKMQRISRNGRKVSTLGGEISGSLYDPIMLLFGSFGANASWCMKTEWWKRHAFFDLGECLDWRIALSTFRSTRISMIDQNLYYYRRHNFQVTTNRKVSVEAMDSVYQCWANFAQIFGLQQNHRKVFEVLATPWNYRESADYIEIASWLESFHVILGTLKPEIQKTLVNIINRRMLLSFAREKKSVTNASRYLLAGRADLPKFMRDLFGLVRN
jgi:hypothetical protein